MQSTEFYFNGDELAVSVFNTKYALQKGNRKEYPEEAVNRVITPLLDFEPDKSIGNKWLTTWMNGDWRFGGSIFTVGNTEYPKQSTANCTATIVEEDTLESIFKASYEIAKCAAYRQGIGIDVSALRPRGTLLNNSARISEGSLHWLDFISQLANYVGQFGRKPAILGSLNIYHPDIQEFISVKDDLKQLLNMNISVQIPDTFMNAVMKSKNIELKFNGKSHKTINAMKLLTELTQHAYNFGEPGIQFISHMKNHSMQEAVGFKIIGTNAPVIGSHRIATKNGLLCIKDIYKTNKHIEVLIDSRHTEKADKYNYGEVQFVPATFTKHKTQPVYEIELQSYPTITCNDKHKWLTQRGYVETKSLQAKDEILLPSDGIWNIPLTKEEKTSSAYLDGALFGWFAGDGFYTNISDTNRKAKEDNKNKLATKQRKAIGLIWCAGEEAIFDLFVKKYKELTGKQFTYIRDKKTCYETRTGHKAMYEWFASYGFDGVHKEFIPERCWSDRVFAAGFLSGLFGSDGSVSEGRIILTTAVNTLADNIPILLSAFGIYTHTQTTKVTHGVMYTLKNGITKESKYKPLRYYIKIGSQIPRKRMLQRIGLFNPILLQKLETAVQEDNTKQKYTNLAVKVKNVTNTGKFEDMYCAVVPNIHGLIIQGLMSSNCSEKSLSKNGVCNLASINFGNLSVTDWRNQLNKLVPDIVRFMDDVTTYELVYKKSPLPEQKFTVENLREIGIGVTNVHAWLLKQNVSYGSKKGNKLLEDVISYISKVIWVTSEKLASERGNFPAYDKAKLQNSQFYKYMSKQVYEPKGLRFAANMSIAPAGSISLILPKTAVSSGVEPAIGFAYWRKTRINNSDYDSYFVLTEVLKQAILEKVDNDYERKFIEDIDGSVLDNDGTIGNIVNKIVDKYELDKVYKGAHDIAVEDKLALLAKLQPWIDAGISTTFNLAPEYPDFMLPQFVCDAWQKGIKCLSIYREGSRNDILSFKPPITEKNTENIANRPKEITYTFSPKRPENLPCDIHKVIVKGQKYVVLVGMLNGKVYEVFAGKIENIDIPTTATTGNIVKQKSKTYNLHIEMDRINKVIPDLAHTFMNAEHGALTRSISRELRHGIPIYFIVDGLKKSEGDITDFSKVLARVLSKYNGHIPSFVQKLHNCPNCGEPLTVEGGCEHCITCGYSKCE